MVIKMSKKKTLYRLEILTPAKISEIFDKPCKSSTLINLKTQLLQAKITGALIF